MQLGKSLMGALLGAVVGVILLVAVHMQWGIDRNWLAIPVAILTGLGVRALATTYGHESYLRGAITALIALGAFMFGMDRAAKIAVSRAANANAATLPNLTAPPLENVMAAEREKPTADPAASTDSTAATEDAAKPADATEPNNETAGEAAEATANATPSVDASTQQVAKPPAVPVQNVSGNDRMRGPNPAEQPSTLDYVWLAVAALVAYQLGRGSAIDPRMAGNTVAPPDAT